MRKFYFAFVGILFSGVLSFSFIVSSVCVAEPSAPSIKLGIVRLGKVFDGYDKTKSSESQMESLSNEKQAEREKIVSEIKNMREELVLLNEDSRHERQQAIEEKIKGLANFDREAKEALRKQREEVLKGIFDEIEVAVSGYAKQNGFQMILTDRAILYGVDSLDVTDDILSILNGRSAKNRPDAS